MFFTNHFKKTVRWIPVTERLPNKWKDVIVADIDGITDIGWVDNDDKWLTYDVNGDAIELVNVKYWFAIPSAPQ